MATIQYFSLKNFAVESGVTLPEAKLAYQTYGQQSEGKKVVLVSTCFSERLQPEQTLVGEGKPLDPSRYFVVQVALFGGADSSSPSNTTAPFDGKNFPNITYSDNIRAHKQLLDHLKVEHLHAVVGFSMGGQVAYHWGTIHPTFVDKIVCLATSAATTWHNYVFLEGPKAALVASGSYEAGTIGPKAFSRVYCGWAKSHQFFQQEKFKEAGFKTVDEYLVGAWENQMGRWNGYDLLTLLWTWQHGSVATATKDIGSSLGFTTSEEALKAMKAEVLIMPSRTDAYFVPEVSEEEVKIIPNAKLAIIESIHGHSAGGGGGSEEDNEFLWKTIGGFLG